jgi:hypothetical protein
MDPRISRKHLLVRPVSSGRVCLLSLGKRRAYATQVPKMEMKRKGEGPSGSGMESTSQSMHFYPVAVADTESVGQGEAAAEGNRRGFFENSVKVTECIHGDTIALIGCPRTICEQVISTAMVA